MRSGSRGGTGAHPRPTPPTSRPLYLLEVSRLAIRLVLHALCCLRAIALRARWLVRRVTADRAADASDALPSFPPCPPCPSCPGRGLRRPARRPGRPRPSVGHVGVQHQDTAAPRRGGSCAAAGASSSAKTLHRSATPPRSFAPRAQTPASPPANDLSPKTLSGTGSLFVRLYTGRLARPSSRVAEKAATQASASKVHGSVDPVGHRRRQRRLARTGPPRDPHEQLAVPEPGYLPCIAVAQPRGEGVVGVRHGRVRVSNARGGGHRGTRRAGIK